MKKTLDNRIVYYNEKCKIHREDGLPTVEYNNGDRKCYINCRKHRTDGPVVEWINGYKSWYLNDIRYTEEEFNQELIKLKLKRLINL